MNKLYTVILIFLIVSLSGCGSTGSNRIENPSGKSTTYVDSSRRGPVSGVGIESQDIFSMTDQMMRSLVNSGLLERHDQAPRIIVDSKYFKNESSQRINKNLITDRLRSGLIKAAAGRVVFVARENVAMVEHERSLKRSGTTDSGTVGMTKATAGADYRLTGRISSLNQSDASGYTQRYSQFTFELVDLEFGTIVWGDQYEFSKAAQDDVIYR